MVYTDESPGVQYLGHKGSVVIKQKMSAWDMKAAKKNCKKCFGRGYTGRWVNTGEILVCPCVPLNLVEPPPPEVVEVVKEGYKGPSLTDAPQGRSPEDEPTTAPMGESTTPGERIGGENEKIDQSPPQLVDSANK